MRAFAALALFVCLPTFCGDAAAQTSTGKFNVQLTVNAQCLLLATNDLNFGSAGALTSNIDQTTTLAVQCTNGTPFNLGLNQGLNGGSVSNRVLKSSTTTGTVAYQLYRDAGRSQVWGSTVGTDTYSAAGTGALQNVTVYGRIPAQNSVAPGTYSDAITVTLTY